MNFEIKNYYPERSEEEIIKLKLQGFRFYLKCDLWGEKVLMNTISVRAKRGEEEFKESLAMYCLNFIDYGELYKSYCELYRANTGNPEWHFIVSNKQKVKKLGLLNKELEKYDIQVTYECGKNNQ